MGVDLLMPYIKRDTKGRIVAVFANQQYDDKGNSLNYEYVDNITDDDNNELYINGKIEELKDLLSSGDYKVIRHAEQVICNETTTLTNEEFKNLSLLRQQYRKSIHDLLGG
jgi:ABC-type xylose transport system substrate-binding protein